VNILSYPTVTIALDFVQNESGVSFVLYDKDYGSKTRVYELVILGY
jgi:hypothetical protein